MRAILLLAAGLTLLSSCVTPQQYDGLIEFDRQGLERRLTILCRLGVGDATTRRTCTGLQPAKPATARKTPSRRAESWRQPENFPTTSTSQRAGGHFEVQPDDPGGSDRAQCGNADSVCPAATVPDDTSATDRVATGHVEPSRQD